MFLGSRRIYQRKRQQALGPTIIGVSAEAHSLFGRHQLTSPGGAGLANDYTTLTIRQAFAPSNELGSQWKLTLGRSLNEMGSTG